MRIKIKRRYARLHMLARDACPSRCRSLSSSLEWKRSESSCFNAACGRLLGTRDASNDDTAAAEDRLEGRSRIREAIAPAWIARRVDGPRKEVTIYSKQRSQGQWQDVLPDTKYGISRSGKSDWRHAAAAPKLDWDWIKAP